MIYPPEDAVNLYCQGLSQLKVLRSLFLLEQSFVIIPNGLCGGW
jgi:hypothetical protein